MDVGMLWKEIATGFVLAGAAAQLPNSFFTSLFVAHAPHPVPTLENVVVGPVIAVLRAGLASPGCCRFCSPI
jgi:hypothetical protein